MIGGQLIFAFVGGEAFSVVPLSGVQWAYSLILGIASIPVGFVIRLIPDALVDRLITGGKQFLNSLNCRNNRS